MDRQAQGSETERGKAFWGAIAVLVGLALYVVASYLWYPFRACREVATATDSVVTVCNPLGVEDALPIGLLVMVAVLLVPNLVELNFLGVGFRRAETQAKELNALASIQNGLTEKVFAQATGASAGTPVEPAADTAVPAGPNSDWQRLLRLAGDVEGLLAGVADAWLAMEARRDRRNRPTITEVARTEWAQTYRREAEAFLALVARLEADRGARTDVLVARALEVGATLVESAANIGELMRLAEARRIRALQALLGPEWTVEVAPMLRLPGRTLRPDFLARRGDETLIGEVLHTADPQRVDRALGQLSIVRESLSPAAMIALLMPWPSGADLLLSLVAMADHLRLFIYDGAGDGVVEVDLRDGGPQAA